MNWSMADWQTRHEAGEQKLLSTALLRVDRGKAAEELCADS
jgi:hypothetical protein